ncbi:MAG TPA: hypothetical protein PK156_27490, partial [Polyangium sp.]|nr:hypothetical protein [Polyangium sp.]
FSMNSMTRIRHFQLVRFVLALAMVFKAAYGPGEENERSRLEKIYHSSSTFERVCLAWKFGP